MTSTPSLTPQDDHLWLEEIDGKAQLDWARQENAKTVQTYAQSPAFKALEAGILEVLDSDERIPMVRKIGPFFYNFWRDKEHPKGLWRRTTLTEYRKPQPAWETVIDIDALAAADKENWVWHGADCLEPDYKRCLISLSRGGADADVVREFDLHSKRFVEGGFTLPEAKNHVGWKDIDHLYVATDFGPGSMTSSSYPRIVKEWKRGTPLKAAVTVYEGAHEDMSVSAYRDNTPGFERDFVSRQIDFYESETWLRGAGDTLTKIDVPDDSNTDIFREWMLIEPREDWTVGGATYKSGSLLAAKFDDYMAGKRELTVLFAPDDTTALDSHSWTRHHLILNVMHDVVNKLEVLTPQDGGPWKRESLGGAPALSTIAAGGIDEDENDDYFLTVSGFLQPTTLYIGTIGQGEPEVLKDSPGFFDASRYGVSQHFAVSKDGTRVPYFEIAPKDLKADGTNPTLQYAYGGFEISLQPSYSGSIGRAWLEQGGVYVIANIRGGGEYGPRWHQAALQENRLRTCEDFAAVSEDLIARKITSPAHLGAMGGSNGGLLMGNMLTLYPQLYGAIVSEVALLDMQRYTHLSAGASWIAEYGDPDQPEEWAFIRTFSPYENAKADAHYPPALFTTSTRDDRVGPVHARKMHAKLAAQGHDTSFYENMEGGHSAATDNKESAFMDALGYAYLWQHIGKTE
ncbi:prolyl oligopeptidase [Variovorax boronicumulans]|uniref:Prolyl oligopeptidase n=1 Tax=Variovorax boronicumulans TaxID=436515 RepID=A0AAW8CVU6_9BURK|nr:prolyl oligopeptidase family serine peptidase [Variovorax boronicumulans]MDP9894564.1 prolyl oligopeptidase [Variovorax boronicumulans]MDQ0054383.1 prolyl oligopeptidase [Variovorax boronicumulans]